MYSPGDDNITLKHGGHPYQFLSRHVERQNQRQSKEGSPITSVSLLTDKKGPGTLGVSEAQFSSKMFFCHVLNKKYK